MSLDSSRDRPPRTHNSHLVTDDWLEFIALQTERAVKKGTREGVRGYRNQALVGFLALLIGVGANFLVRDHDQSVRRHDAQRDRATQIRAIKAAAVTNCNALYDAIVNNRRLLALSDRASAQQYASGVITLTQRKAAKRFYFKLEEQQRLPDCRKQARLLSTDPARQIPTVTPRYPGDGRG